MTLSSISSMFAPAPAKSANRETERAAASPPPRPAPETQAERKPQKLESLTDKFREDIKAQLAKGDIKPAPGETEDVFVARAVGDRMRKFIEDASSLVAMQSAAAPPPMLVDITV